MRRGGFHIIIKSTRSRLERHADSELGRHRKSREHHQVAGDENAQARLASLGISRLSFPFKPTSLRPSPSPTERVAP